MIRLAAAAIALGLFISSQFATVNDNPDEACFRMKTNALRSRSLGEDARIDRVARNHSNEMAADETIYHSQDLASDLPPYEYGGENVGMGPDCNSIFEAFKSSPGHRENMLDLDYKFLGVGVTVRDETLYVTLTFFTPAVRAPVKPAVSPEECER